MSSKRLRLRRPLTRLTKVTAGALFVNALGYAAELLRLGPFDPEVSIVVVLLLGVAASVALGWRWTPLLGGLLAGAIILGNPFLLTNLSNPGEDLFFVATIIEVASGLTAFLVGIAATVQNYRAWRTTKSDARSSQPAKETSVFLEDKEAAISGTHGGRRTLSYRTQVAGVLAAAFTLSLAYSAIVTVTGSHEGYGLGDPILWILYAVGFGLAAMALMDRIWAWLVVAVTVLILIALGIFYYPTVFPPSAQTPLAWFENDVYMGLLVLAEYLCVQRLRNVFLTPER